MLSGCKIIKGLPSFSIYGKNNSITGLEASNSNKLTILISSSILKPKIVIFVFQTSLSNDVRKLDKLSLANPYNVAFVFSSLITTA